MVMLSKFYRGQHNELQILCIWFTRRHKQKNTRNSPKTKGFRNVDYFFRDLRKPSSLFLRSYH